MLMGSTTMAIMNILSKVIYRNTAITFLQISIFRALFMSVGSFILAQIGGVDVLAIPKDQSLKLYFRALFGTISATF